MTQPILRTLAAAVIGASALALSSAAFAQAPAAPAAGPVGIVDNPCPAQAARQGGGPPGGMPQGGDPGRPGGPNGAMADRTPEQQAAIRADIERRRTQDRAGLCTFRADNAAIAAGTAPQPTVIFIGDSITAFWPRLDSAFFGDNKYTGRGIGAQVTAQGLMRFQPDVINLHPKVIHIMMGTNDIAGLGGPTSYENVQNNLMAMVALARANNIAVVIATIPPMTTREKTPNWSRLKPNIAHLNEWIRAYAKRENLALADIFPVLADADGNYKPELNSDGVHPTLAGYQVMDPVSKAAINLALAKQKHR